MEAAGGTYQTYVTTGAGGDSTGALGGQGGDLTKVSLSLNAGYQNDAQDDTSSAYLTAGHGGVGTNGGAGGSLSDVTSVSVFHQLNGSTPEPGAVTMQLIAGNGGQGLKGAGGAGGSVTLKGAASLSGVTYYDIDSPNAEAQALQVEGGNGGNGVTAGGAGGALINVGAQNALFGANLSLDSNELSSALIQSGNGGTASAGTGGAGGAITGLNLGVQNVVLAQSVAGTTITTPVVRDGSATVISGSGGDATGGVGGNAGVVSQSTVASVTGDPILGYGLFIQGGIGGTGDHGRRQRGRNQNAHDEHRLDQQRLCRPYSSAAMAARRRCPEREAGAAPSRASPSPRMSTRPSTPYRPATAAPAPTARAARAVRSKNSTPKGSSDCRALLPRIPWATPRDRVFTWAFSMDVIASETISSLFATGTSVPQGIFVGRGADGANNGSVLDIVARQIAAIGATVDAAGTFAPAKAINNISADLIGYDANQNGKFDSSVASGGSPAVARPVDGFLLASPGGISQINITGGNDTSDAGVRVHHLKRCGRAALTVKPIPKCQPRRARSRLVVGTMLIHGADATPARSASRS